MRELDICAVVLSDYDEDGYPVIQHDAFGEEQSGVQPLEMHHMWGFYGMPHSGERDALGALNPAKCAQVLTGWSNELGYAFPLGDPRLMTKLPQAGGGGSIQYGGRLAQPSFAFIDGNTGSYQIYVPYSFANATNDAVPMKASGFAINVRRSGQETIEIVHGDGMSITMSAEGKSMVLKNAAGDAYIELNEEGITLNGNVKITGALDIGGPGAVPLMTGAMTPCTLVKGL